MSVHGAVASRTASWRAAVRRDVRFAMPRCAVMAMPSTRAIVRACAFARFGCCARGCGRPYALLGRVLIIGRCLRGVVHSCMLTRGSVEATPIPAIDLWIASPCWCSSVLTIGKSVQVGEHRGIRGRRGCRELGHHAARPRGNAMNGSRLHCRSVYDTEW